MASFFESLRTALGRYSVGVHEAAAAATEARIKSAERLIGQALPASYRDFLRSWNGVALFHEAHTLFPIEELRVAEAAPARGPLFVVGETPEGSLWLDPAGRIFLVDEAQPDPLLMAKDVAAWLDATLAREALLVDREGEFRDVFSDDEEAVLQPEIRRKRARLGMKLDPGSALYPLELAELLCEEGETAEAQELLGRATELDPQAGPAWELLAALRRQDGDAAGAEEASLRAASATWDPFLRASRLLDAAEVSSARAREHAQAARAADPDHGEQLLTQARRLLGEGSIDEARRLVDRLRLYCSAPGAGEHPDEGAAEVQAGLQRLERDLRSRDALRVI